MFVFSGVASLTLDCNGVFAIKAYGTQPAGLERTDEEIRHDAPQRLLAELRDQCKARHNCGKTVDGSDLCNTEITRLGHVI